jgi:peptide/nickel transport system substrate-binding protein
MGSMIRTLPPFPVLLACCLALAVALVGCGGGGENPDRDPGASTEMEKPQPGGMAVIAVASEPDVLNPLIHRSSMAGQVVDLLSDPLKDLGEDLRWFPAIAESWDIPEDRKSITFHLRPWRWSDGTPLTARDVELTCQLFVDPRVASPLRGRFRQIASVTALDSFTVRYDFREPVSSPLNQTYHGIVPAHVVEKLDPADVMNWGINRRPLSCGPFVLENWDPGRSLTLARNEYFSGKAALLDRVFLQIIPEQSTRLVALEAGEVDLVADLSPQDARRLEGHPEIQVSHMSGRHYYYLNWNMADPKLQDPLTRRALSLAINRQRMIDTLLEGYGKPAMGPLAPIMWNFHHDLPPDSYDPGRARELLRAAGWEDLNGDGILERDGIDLRFEILTKVGDPIRENGSVILRENFKDVGVGVSIRTMDLAMALELMKEGKYEAYFGSFKANLFGDPSGVVHSLGTNAHNYGRYANAQVDSLLELALATMDRDQALPLWHELQEVLHEDQPSAYLFYPEKLVGIGPRLRDVRPHVLSPLNNIFQWWIPEKDRKYQNSHARN